MNANYRIEAIKARVNAGAPLPDASAVARQSLSAHLSSAAALRRHGAPSATILARAARLDAALQGLRPGGRPASAVVRVLSPDTA